MGKNQHPQNLPHFGVKARLRRKDKIVFEPQPDRTVVDVAEIKNDEGTIVQERKTHEEKMPDVVVEFKSVRKARHYMRTGERFK